MFIYFGRYVVRQKMSVMLEGGACLDERNPIDVDKI